MGNIGSSELLVILILALLLLGPKRLPEIGESLGRTLRRFRSASRELREELENERRSLDVDRDLDDATSPPPPPPPANTQARERAADPKP